MLDSPVDPMLAILADAIPEGNYIYEVKWDGIRAIITLQNGNIRITSRNKNDITGQFPELKTAEAFNCENGIFDAEIIALNKSGQPSFKNVIQRLKTSSEKKIEQLSQSNPVQCYVFDCLYLNGQQIMNQVLDERYKLLKATMTSTGQYILNDIFDDGHELYNAIEEQGMEGIMAKRKDSRYMIGKRSDSWKKVKIRHEALCLVIGYTKGKGDHANHFGALHLAEERDGDLFYRGKVGTGFSQAKLERIFVELDSLEEVNKPNYAPVSKDTTWVEPKLGAEVTYSEVTSGGVFRDPVFVRLHSA